ncbi:MAG TPA: HD domain-containing phosphohydrolase [Gemmatimonadales bacterium]|nr:HD domain-containing phosphohydrolase [Gemmatimonadales bacterium]
MRDYRKFLTALSRTLSTMGLYGDEHPATRRAVESAYTALHDLQSAGPGIEFTFLSGEVLAGAEVLPELEGWEWSDALARAGIERIEFIERLDADQFDRLLGDLAARLGVRPASSADRLHAGPSPVRFGLVTLADQGETRPDSDLAVAGLSYALRDERDAVAWVHNEVRTGGRLPAAEADGVVRSLSLAMHAQQAMILPLLQLKEYDQYTTTHSMNVSVLAMALGEYLELGTDTVRALGLAGLLHDLGKVCIPEEILNKPGRLTKAERRVVHDHPVVGARMLLSNSDPLEFAAVVAYEHHIMIDGGGYPHLPDARETQYASRLVHVCDVYDALRTKRPYRDAWESERAIAYIEGRAGIEFDPAIARSFVAMMREWDRRIQTSMI